ncbi:MAG: type II toxin-antitoxin system YafQ family toxin [Bacteroidales bacterium]|nr:type II toxin-antitoxin system YafQ family toxin [Bacteroidales bacterium]MCF8345423.1 type II toxin-antitoxin system YafQ family toxin [Bacteroidales bacterium]
MYRIRTTKRFVKDFAKCSKRNYDLALLEQVLELLVQDGKLPQKYWPHVLSGNLNGYWECHVKPDWLLIWKQDDENQIIDLVRTGTHSDLF